MISRREALKLGAGATGIAMTSGIALWWLRREDDSTEQLKADPPDSPGHPDSTADTNDFASDPGHVTRVTGEVGVDGFALVFGSVRVMAPAGVAAQGTTISVSGSAQSTPPELTTLSSAMGDPIDIVLGDNQQPDQPITISFKIDPMELAVDVSDEFPLIVVTTSEDEQVPGYLQGTWDPEESILTVITDHLSPFGWFQFDLGKWISDFIGRLLGLSFPKPSCTYQPASVSGRRYSFVDPGDDSIWPCINHSNDQIMVKLHSNSVLPWAVKSAPVAPGTVSGSFKDLGPGLASIYQELYAAMGDQRLALMPGNSVSLAFSASTPPEIVQLKLDPGLYLASTLLYAVQSSLTMFFGGGGRVAETVLEGFEGLDCILEIQNTFYEMEDDGNLTGVVKSTLSCVLVLMEENLPRLSGKFIGKAILTVINLLVGGASLIAAGLLGAYRTATSNDQFTFVISAEGAQIETSSGPQNEQGPSLDQPIVVKWTKERYAPRFMPPAIANGALYYGTQTSFQAYSMATGDELWTKSDMASDIWATPAVADGVIYVSSYFDHASQTTSHMQALDEATGNTLWEVLIQAKALFRPIYGQGLVYAESYEAGHYFLNAFDAQTGNMHWKTPHGGHGIAYSDGILFTSDAEMTLYALDATTGNEQWHAKIGDGVMSPIVLDGVIYAYGWGSVLCAIDPHTRELIWQFAPADTLSSTPLFANGKIFVHGASALYAIDARTGDELWEFAKESDRKLFDYSCIADDVVYLSSSDQLYALDAGSGAELWRFGLGETLISRRTIAVGSGMVLVGTEVNGLTALGNVQPARLIANVRLHAAPAPTGIERGTANAGTEIERVRGSVQVGSQSWAEVTINGIDGWIPLDAIDPATLPPKGEIDYVYIPN